MCSRPLPPDWNLDLQVDGLPFTVQLQEVEAWRQEVRDCFGTDPEPGVDDVVARLDNPWTFVAHFFCGYHGGELAGRCAKELVLRCGGFCFLGDDEPSEVFAGQEGVRGADIVAAWRTLVRDEQERAERARRKARAAFDEAAARDPATYKKANDWSDV